MLDTEPEPFDRELAEANAKLLSVSELKTRLLLLLEDINAHGTRPTKAVLMAAMVDAQEAAHHVEDRTKGAKKQLTRKWRIMKSCSPMTMSMWTLLTTV